MDHTITYSSVWAETARLPQRPALERDTTADACVVGAGIAGMSTAYLLARGGMKVVVLDDGEIASGQTQVTTAHLSNEIDDRYAEIERMHGADGARMAAESHTAAIDLIESISNREGIDCDFFRLDGYLFKDPSQPSDVLEQEFHAARRTEIVEVEQISRAPLDSFDTGPCLRFGGQGQFHPLKYLAGLAEAITRYGGRIYCHTHAKSIQGGIPGKVATANGPSVVAKALVVATNTPVNDLIAIHTKQAPYMTYVTGLRVPAGAIHRGLFWDTLDPYHYVRLQPEEDGSHEILIVGGEDHKTGQADDAHERFARLEAWARARFPLAGEVVYHWAGQVMETVDGLAYIGRNPMDKENVYIATGDSGMGMTHGTIAGMILSDLIQGKENRWAKLYDPSRSPLRSPMQYVKENLNVAAQYASWVTPGEVGSAEEVRAGHGAILRQGLRKVALYRGESGGLVKLSATCPHLKCIVDWNDAEKTWDCPCHGSRFSPEGKVLNGPANRDLERLDGV
jgi:glycine/D-amino acid oxidase-like deaminating enzyme/nitrite reductase/ring-hydroxylating ferredoxin subunit